MAKPLVIVESPAKARTISGFLGSGFVVEASLGNIRDLPRSAAEIPARVKGEPWAQLGVDVEHGFKPVYIVPKEKKEQVKKLKDLLADASELYLATDEDREGESIAWHLLETLKPDVPVKRMVFHEISRAAIERAVEEWRELDMQLVGAQETRRILDRLYGYEVSPVLWKKVMTGLSAGRVQSVATRIVVQRERERIAFVSADHWDIVGTFAPTDNGEDFGATLISVDGTRVATGRDFTPAGALKENADVVRLDQARASSLADALRPSAFTVRSVEEKPYRTSPHAPFMTSTLQQEAGRKLRFSSRRTMQVAQRLYENGYITYMRTDSTVLSEEAVAAARSAATELYGRDHVPDKPRVYARKTKSAQEAHEAIRPAGDTFRSPEQVARQVGPDEARLYELVWKRTVASQMEDARGRTMQVRLGATTDDGTDALFATSGRTITFPGFLRAYVEGSDDPDADLEDRQRVLPHLEEGMSLDVRELEPTGHETQPPSRYTEPSLIRAVEELGVGRPSTYAAMISTIQDRGYVWKRGSALVPSWTAFAVITLLEQHFGELVDYDFTARMEDVLDEIASGDEQPEPWLRRFYTGNGQPGLKNLVQEALEQADARQINSYQVGDAPDGDPVVVRVGRYGPFVQHGEDTASLPDDLAPDELTVVVGLELIERQSKGDRLLGEDPDTGLPVYLRAGRYGPYVQLGEAGESKEKPRTASLFRTMEPEHLTLDDALTLLQLPRVVGAHPEDGEEILAMQGRYGPYLKKGTDSRSIDSEEQLLTITLEEAVAIFAQPKQRGRRQAKTLKELGEDPVSGAKMLVMEGRYGPYVTDGEVNASLRKEDDPETITDERASELLQMRREKAPPKKKRSGKKKSAKKKTSSKKKASPKKTSAKKKSPPK